MKLTLLLLAALALHAEDAKPLPWCAVDAHSSTEQCRPVEGVPKHAPTSDATTNVLQSKPPVIPADQLTAYVQATSALAKAEAVEAAAKARLDVIAKQEARAAAAEKIIASCGDAFTPNQAPDGVISCAAKAAPSK